MADWTRMVALRRAFLGWAIGLCLLAAGHAESVDFEFRLNRGVMTSAGVYDREGRLVRVLWTMKNLPAGSRTGEWDGRDEFGEPAPAGEYQWKVVLNESTYRNVGAIGNSGQPPNAFGHVPTNFESVAVDAEGNIYTANWWDEAGADFKKWDSQGQPVYDARYQIRNGQPNGAPYSIAVDDEYLYCGVGGWAHEPWNGRQQIQRFRLEDGKHVKFTKVEGEDGHIQVHEWPARQIPEDTPDADRATLERPLRALTVVQDTLFVADALGDRVRMYNKTTGESLGEFGVKRPVALAIDSQGRLWIGHERRLVSVFTANGKPAADNPVLRDLGEVRALAIGPTGDLYLADAGAGQVKIYDIRSAKPRLRRAFGRAAEPGDRAPDRFYELRGVAVDRAGHPVTIQVEPTGGARLARWTAEGELLWEHFGCEFVSLGNYGREDPERFYSMTQHRYRLRDHETGAWEYLGNAFAGGRSYTADPHGVPRVLRLGRNDFFYLPSGDGVQVYRIGEKIMRLAALVGGQWPAPDGRRAERLGQWTWHDESGDGLVHAGEMRWFKDPGEGAYHSFGMDVDQRGHIWFANLSTRGICEIPLGPLDGRGNPTYDWASAREVIAADVSPLMFQPTMAQRADDGSVYAFGWSAAWPAPPNNPFWMGGTTLVRFDSAGVRQWAVPLPEVGVGLDVIPGEGAGQSESQGCVVGVGDGARILHYTADGLLVGSMKPGPAMGEQSGWLDNHASVAVNRHPRDHRLDVFVEDDYVQRIGWYRIDDRPVEVLTGRIRK